MVGAIGGCDDVTSCCESSVPAEEHSEGNDCMDLCLCSCCGNSVFFDVKKEIDLSTVNYISSQEATFIYQSQVSNIFYADIWQPPKQA